MTHLHNTKSLILLIFSLFTLTTSAEILVKDIGIIGLASHDLFSWDRKNEINLENGAFDLSTIFDYQNGERWEKGGDPKNSENSPVWSLTRRLIDEQKKNLKSLSHLPSGQRFIEARKLTVKKFHQILKNTFKRLSKLNAPSIGIKEKVNNYEQAALRAFHDVLPGKVKTYSRGLIREFKLTNFLFAKYYLNDKAFNAKVPTFDGDYAYEFKNIKIPFSNVVVNLMEVDRKFIETFSPYIQRDMLDELRDVGLGKKEVQDLTFFFHIKDMFAKGFCPHDSIYMPKIECL